MEVKVWMDGYQRIVCGVTEETTCQDIMIALAQATGMTGRYSMFEKWRTKEFSLSPTDSPLLVLQKWGEYSNNVQLVIHRSFLKSGRKRKVRTNLDERGKCGSPKQIPLKKNLTFSGAHRRSCSLERPASSNISNCARNGRHSVESSEQSSVTSRSSASLSPYMSLERQTQKNSPSPSHCVREEGSEPNHLRHSKDRTLFTKILPPTKPDHLQIYEGALPPKIQSQPPVPSKRHTKTQASNNALQTQISKPVQSNGLEVSPEQNKKQLKSGYVTPETSCVPSVVSRRENQVESLQTSKILNGSSLTETKEHKQNTKTLVTDSTTELSRVHVLKRTSNQVKNIQAENREIKEPDKGNKSLQNFPVAAKRNFVPGAKPNKNQPSIADAESKVSSSSITSAEARKPSTPERGITSKKCSDADVKVADEKKELIALIGQQEDEIRKCESRLKNLDSEILLIENDLEVDEKQLERQIQKIEELETLEKEVENELEELELVSWEEKLEIEKQKENRIRTEIVLLQSSIAKSESEIQAFVQKIKSLTAKTEEATQELNCFLKEKKEKENKEVEELETNLHQMSMESQMSQAALKSLEEKILAMDASLYKKKQDLMELETQLKKHNLELFLKELPEITSAQRNRTAVVDRLGLARPGSSRRLQHYQLTPTPRRLNRTIDEIMHEPCGYVV